MNPDEIKSLLIKIGVLVLTSIATKYHISGDTVTAVVTDLADVAVLGYGIYDHWNEKKVPETAVVVQPAPGTPTTPPAGKTITGTVIALALVCLTGALLSPGAAQAQNRAPNTTTHGLPCDLLNLLPGCETTPDFISSVKNQIGAPTQKLNEFSPQQIADKIGKLALADFVYADGLAKSTKNMITEPCWASWVNLLTQQQQPIIGPALTEAVAWVGPGAAFATKSPHNLMVGQAVTFASPPAGITAGTVYYVIAENFTSDTFEVSAAIGGTGVNPTAPAAAGSSVSTQGQVLQRPDPGLVTNVEYLSEAVQLLQSNSPIAIACAPMAAALQKDIATLLSSIVTGGAFGLFKLPIAIP